MLMAHVLKFSSCPKRLVPSSESISINVNSVCFFLLCAVSRRRTSALKALSKPFDDVNWRSGAQILKLLTFQPACSTLWSDIYSDIVGVKSQEQTLTHKGATHFYFCFIKNLLFDTVKSPW